LYHYHNAVWLDEIIRKTPVIELLVQGCRPRLGALVHQQPQAYVLSSSAFPPTERARLDAGLLAELWLDMQGEREERLAVK